jgi:hypothetical protein
LDAAKVERVRLSLVTSRFLQSTATTSFLKTPATQNEPSPAVCVCSYNAKDGDSRFMSCRFSGRPFYFGLTVDEAIAMIEVRGGAVW